MKLEGKTAIVTGGRTASALRSRSATSRKARASSLRISTKHRQGRRGGAGGAARFVRTDVGAAGDARNVIAEACRLCGRPRHSGEQCRRHAHGGFSRLAEADFDRVLRINLKGMFLVGQAAARQMVAQVKAGKPPGAIVNMSSINARVAIPNQVPYCVSKGGVDQLTKVMALSLAPYGIRVNAIGPGSIMTDILKGLATDQAAKNRLLSRTPLGRVAEPDEIAAIAAFLASTTRATSPARPSTPTAAGSR